ncbi:MAG: carotenoid biosynthesis protein [Tannerellaceae bacterium]
MSVKCDKVESILRSRFATKQVLSLLFWIYLIGAIGFSLNFTRVIFSHLSWCTLLVTFLLICISERRNLKSKNAVFFFILGYLFSFVIEMIGVQTGVLFGSYQYAYGLGLKLADTPLLIGINWLMLTMGSASISNMLIANANKTIHILLGASLMVFYDVLMEQVASFMEMWSWKDDLIPIQNYVMWFGASLVMHGLYRYFKIQQETKISVSVFVFQYLFFLIVKIRYQL